MTEMDKPPAPGAALLVAVSGPLTSLAVSAVALGAGMGLGAGPGWELLAAVLVWLGWANLLLGAFNLLPAAPLDGGHVVQAAMWWRTGNRERAELAVGRSGQILGMLLVGFGWFVLLSGALGGLWLAFVGLFIMIVAKAQRQQAALTTALKGARAADAMSGPVETAPDWLMVRQLVDGPTAFTRHLALPLLDFEGRPSGLLPLSQLARVPPAQRELVRLREVARPCRRARPARRTTFWRTPSQTSDRAAVVGFSSSTATTSLASSLHATSRASPSVAGCAGTGTAEHASAGCGRHR
jgi:hypothetical protein